MSKTLRIYADTSVLGGCFDAAFAKDSLRLIEGVRRRRVTLLVGEVLLAELAESPAEVQELLISLPEDAVERVSVSAEILQLRDAYIEAGVVGERWSDDAAHVATATVARADAIVSWNFRHIVRLDKMKAYNRVNVLNGYGILTIVTPREVLTNDRE
jgi:predicted nucleic acid-binding protein